MEPELHSTMRKGQFHDIRLLVSCGVDVNVRNSDGRTPLILCSFLSQEGWAVGIARMFLEKGGLVGLKDKFGRNGLMYATIFQRLELLNLYLKAVDFDVNETDRYGNTALFYAATSGNAVAMHAIIQKLIHFKLSVDKPNKWGMTPLMEACRLGYKECCSVLRNFGLADETPRDLVLAWNAQKWAAEREREIEAKQRKRSVYDKPWLENSRGYHLSPVETLSSSFSSSSGSWKTRSMTSISPHQDEPADTTDDKLPMLKCKSKIKIEKIRKDWIKETVKKETILVKYQPSPSNYAVLSANTVPGRMESSKQMKMNSLKDRLDENAGQPWVTNFKQIFHQYEMQVTGSYRRAAAAPPAQTDAAAPGRVKGGPKENSSKEDKRGVLKGTQLEGKPISSWPSLSSVTSSKKSRAADFVEVFLASAKTKKDRTIFPDGDSVAKTKDITSPRKKQIRLNKLLQDKT